jgi:putative flippase GtrA
MVAMIEWILGVLPLAVRRRVTRDHVRLLAQFMQFGVVGVVGFVVDTAALYAIRAPAGLYVGGAIAYLVAVTTTWWLNRIWTFRAVDTVHSAHHQWARFVLANLPGLALNLGTYFTLVALSATCAAIPVIAVAAGAVAGMFANFFLTRAVVFR